MGLWGSGGPVGWLVGVLGWSLRLGGASWGSWVGAVKNDTNFQGGYAYAVAAQCPHWGGLGQKNRPTHPVSVQSRPRPCPILSNPVPSPVIARDLGSCVPAERTGTRAMGPFPGKSVWIKWSYHGKYVGYVGYPYALVICLAVPIVKLCYRSLPTCPTLCP